MFLTTEETYCNAEKVLNQFSDNASAKMLKDKYFTSTKVIPDSNLKLIWLFIFAMDNYSIGATNNYITEQQLMAMFAKANSIL